MWTRAFLKGSRGIRIKSIPPWRNCARARDAERLLLRARGIRRRLQTSSRVCITRLREIVIMRSSHESPCAPEGWKSRESARRSFEPAFRFGAKVLQDLRNTAAIKNYGSPGVLHILSLIFLQRTVCMFLQIVRADLPPFFRLKLSSFRYGRTGRICFCFTTPLLLSSAASSVPDRCPSDGRYRASSSLP